ncbi:MAG: hypothetical protein K2X57_17295 [Xanthobacteraceae bacterium]|nr:hypothetical protein [Xanthobacteraceae bacterium]
MSQTFNLSNPLSGELRASIRVSVWVLLASTAAPVLAVAAYIAFWSLVPAYSASTVIADLQATLTLRFYYIWDQQTDRGRYLSMTTPGGTTRIAMKAFDWAHNSRTSIYVTPEHKIGIVGPTGDDYLASPDPLQTVTARGPSYDWAYLGAFDFELLQGNARRLRFVSAAEQAECIPMRGAYIESDQVRKMARQRACDHYVDPAEK